MFLYSLDSPEQKPQWEFQVESGIQCDRCFPPSLLLTPPKQNKQHLCFVYTQLFSLLLPRGQAETQNTVDGCI